MGKTLYAVLGGGGVLYVGENHGEFCKSLNNLKEGDFFESYTIRREEGSVSLVKLTGKVEGKLKFDQENAIPTTINEETVIQALKGFL